MSKFDDVLKRISEALPTTSAQPQQPVKPVAGAQPAQQQNPQQQQQAVQQAAKLLNMDPKVLQQILDAQQQKPAPGTQPAAV